MLGVSPDEERVGFPGSDHVRKWLCGFAVFFFGAVTRALGHATLDSFFATCFSWGYLLSCVFVCFQTTLFCFYLRSRYKMVFLSSVANTLDIYRSNRSNNQAIKQHQDVKPPQLRQPPPLLRHTHPLPLLHFRKTLLDRMPNVRHLPGR